jgi:hypothetical protein
MYDVDLRVPHSVCMCHCILYVLNTFHVCIHHIIIIHYGFLSFHDAQRHFEYIWSKLCGSIRGVNRMTSFLHSLQLLLDLDGKCHEVKEI